MGDADKEVSDEDEGKAGEALSKGKQALGNNDAAGAVAALTESIKFDARKTRYSTHKTHVLVQPTVSRPFPRLGVGGHHFAWRFLNYSGPK